MYSVFVSYSREDLEIAENVASLLDSSEYKVFIDQKWHIAVGATLTNMIDEGCNVATCVLVLWSKAAVESQWVNSEAGIGMERGRLLQVTLDGTKPPDVFREYIYGSLENWDGTKDHEEFQRIIKGIEFFLERDAKNES
jgi:hypothetical protein